ncbi:MAG: hypothetical protein IRZ32_14855 [Solirubrobacteraceae bacterium]|nr:hypothetical protein [Solirubrobacteraceae bacterium]
MSVLDFLTPATGPDAPVAEGPLAAALAAAGATFAIRDGWRVPVHLGDAEAEARAARDAVAWADVSHLRKLELHGPHGLELGAAARRDDGWLLPLTPTRALAVGETAPAPPPGLDAVDVTTQHAAIAVAGPATRETLARFCALDLRPAVAPPGSVRPGSIARTPGIVVVEAPDRLLLLVGAAVALHVWAVLGDAGTHLGGRAAGVDALAGAEVAAHA